MDGGTYNRTIARSRKQDQQILVNNQEHLLNTHPTSYTTVAKGLVLGLVFLSGCLFAQQKDRHFKADSVAELYPNHSLRDIKLLSTRLIEPLSTPGERFRAIYKWVCLNIESDYAMFKINKEKRETLSEEELIKWNLDFSPRVIKELIENQRTVCTGYALLVRELARFAGIEAEVVHGYGRTALANLGGKGIPNHSWIAVKLDGKWQLCDPTWSSGVLSSTTKEFVQRYEDFYYLSEPALFALNHYPLDSKWLLIDSPPSLQEFLNGPLFYVGAMRRSIKLVAPQTLDLTSDGKAATSFSFVVPPQNALSGKVELKTDYFEKGTEMRRTIDSSGFVTYSVDKVLRLRNSALVHIVHGEEFLITFRVQRISR